MSEQNDKFEGQAVSRRQVFMMLADPILERLYRARFEKSEFCIVWCQPGDRWNTALLSFTYDIVVVDFSLFGNDPIENLLEIKRISPESDVIVLSESDDVRTAIAAFQSGINDYFLKPTNPETLAWAIERIMRRREFTSTNEALAADLRVFSAAHHINMCESDVKMRDLTMKNLVGLTNARGGLWVWPEGDPAPGQPPNPDKGPFRMEFPPGTETEGKKALLEFGLTHSELMRHSFDGDLTRTPEKWFFGTFAWIPLRAPWMGGILLYDVSVTPEGTLPARLEFLVRNLEVSLDNYRRFVEARQLTYIDELTGLYNARYLDIAVNAAVDNFRTNNSGFSILFIDVDKFKSVNDTHGHLVGSQLLIEVAHHLKKCMRRKDHIFRYGGDEFICVLYDIALDKAMEAAERLRAEMESHHFLIQNKDIRVTLSIGVARFPEHSRDPKRILALADEAMYSGKKAGRNSVFLAIGLDGEETGAKKVG